MWQPDTAASRDIWSPKHLEHFEQLTKRTIKLTPSYIELYAYGGLKPLKLKGQFNTQLRVGDKTVQTNIIVTKDNSTYPLLSEQTARKLGVVSYNEQFMVNTVNNVIVSSESTIEASIQGLRSSVKQIIHCYPNVFSGKIGRAKEPVKIMIDEAARPVVQRGRKIPYNLEKKAEEKLRDLLEQDIIERVPMDEPRTWVSPPVIALKPKSQQIRFCVDMRLVNKYIKRPNAKLPVTDDVVDKFHSATTFSKLDLKEAYHQFELDQESRHVTTFHGPDGLYRYKRLNYGTKSAQDILQNEMARILSGIPNQANVADDILIGGTEEEHDRTLDQVLKALNENNITVNS